MIDWCDHKAAKWACEHWHYSRCLPVGKLVKIGAWEDGKFIGCVIFSRGANNKPGMKYGLDQTQICELTRVAMRTHKVFVSEVLAQAIKFLKKKSPLLKLIISYSDIEQGHKGGIYQATNWIYVGKTKGETEFVIDNKRVHMRIIGAKYGTGTQNEKWIKENLDPNMTKYKTKGKHKYLFPLNKKARKLLMNFSEKYPKEPDDGVYTNHSNIDLSSV
ncbi:protein Mom [Enterococcus sp. AZ109]|uniref:Mom family adenine methylcarbamoylation protein n=1 Tax=Enterococcus sp. AZ109 TaxID=2774634 RepID=UPI003F6856BB